MRFRAFAVSLVKFAANRRASSGIGEQGADFSDMHFTVNQLRLLSILIHRAPMSVSREDVYRLLYANRRGPQLKILDVMICKIRAQLRRNMIETVWGRGWRWISPK